MGRGVRPLSEDYGNERGTPIHRRYISEFLTEFAQDIGGDCLEFNDPGYVGEYGQGRVSRLDVLHLEPGNPMATVVADLTKPNDIPDGRFDCIVCVHVLHVIVEVERAVADLHRILKPGGVALIAVPQLSMAHPAWPEVYRFTGNGLRTLLARTFGADAVTMRMYGNSLTSAGEIRGLVCDDFTMEELGYHDPRFAIEVCARVVKRSES